MPDEFNADFLQKYNGEWCKVFTTNSQCLVGVVHCHGTWLEVVQNADKRCTVNAYHIISIGKVKV